MSERVRQRYAAAIHAERAVLAADQARTAHELRRRPRPVRETLTPLQACLREMFRAGDMLGLYAALCQAGASGDGRVLAAAEYAFDMRAAEMRLGQSRGR